MRKKKDREWKDGLETNRVGDRKSERETDKIEIA